MGVHLELVNFDIEFNRRSGGEAVILNDLPMYTKKDREDFDRLVFTKFSGDLLSSVPSCDRGCSTGEYNKNIICPECGTPVLPILDQDIEPATWIRAPHGVDALINPMIWEMLSQHFKFGKFNIIHFLCDTEYKPGFIPDKIGMVLELYVQGQPIERGLNYFVRNFWEIMEGLFSLKPFKKPPGRAQVLRRVLDDYRDCIFSQFIPITHRSLLVLEPNELGIFIDKVTIGGMDAIRMLAGIDTDANVYSVRVRENRTAKTINELTIFQKQTYDNNFISKKGVFRKHVFATRSYFSFRAVVSSITDKHHYREIYIPWDIACSLLRVHLLNKLMRMDYTQPEAVMFLEAYARKSHPLLKGMFDELIAEAPSGIGICCTLNRNPSLARGSIEQVYISRIKEPVEGETLDPTVSLSILIVKALNCDFDGDALQFTLALDQRIENALDALAPAMSLFGLDNPRQLANTASLSKPVVANIAEWIEEPAFEDPSKLKYMQQLAMA
jgi:hypothetical protein